MQLIFSLLLCSVAALAAREFNIFDKFSLELKSAIKGNTFTSLNIIVHFLGGTSAVLESILQTRFTNREQRLNTMHDLLVSNAESSQRNSIGILANTTFFYKSFWITNQHYVRNLDISTILEISRLEEVSAIRPEETAFLMEPVEIKNANKSPNYEWGIMKIQAPEAWDVIGRKTGEGIRIATVDTGVRVTHEALRHNFFGEYGWFDPSTAEPLPTDRSGNGTHNTGTIFGSNGIGVAPGAKWMACRGCATSLCSQIADSSLSGLLWWMEATMIAQRLLIVSNSCGGERGNTGFNGVIDAWVAGRIFPVFSVGNSGPRCDSANSPGDNGKLIGVGSTMESDAIPSFSSVVPTLDGIMKPDISAPGSEVVSAYYTADGDYRSLSGTCMAAPHVSGVIALLLKRDVDLSAGNVRGLLEQNTDKELVFSGRIMNHVFGSGRLNALKSVQAQIMMLNL
ncbi:unnamed protein product [Orchesella dallaii]|uniref:Peptidase S8/S53 domain-containing protein n=1 Tax=Orchesella dallaii TaxID=48710 RepID=A0ABP1RIL0_9HEXA